MLTFAELDQDAEPIRTPPPGFRALRYMEMFNIYDTANGRPRCPSCRRFCRPAAWVRSGAESSAHGPGFSVCGLALPAGSVVTSELEPVCARCAEDGTNEAHDDR